MGKRTIDGKGQFEYVANPQAVGPIPEPPQPDPKLHATPATPAMQKTSDNGAKNFVDSAVDTVKQITK
ncbi:hypothetical protein [Leptolyngbya sp. FACHB-1624]|uniref:hypothetical protein n=1 Tax=Leptolyngbya TaxID=47251 RepID=UPI001F556BAD|nr:hypothetical protein [Leptolyngbya sp. FACHB-1624]